MTTPITAARTPSEASAECIQDIYPRYSSRLLDVMVDDYLDAAAGYLAKTGRSHYDLANSVATSELCGADLDRVRGQKAVCVSLFFKAAGFPRRKGHPKHNDSGGIPMSELEAVNHPAWEGTRRHAQSFLDNYLNKVVKGDFHDWVPVVYLARDLSVLEPVLRDQGWVVIPVQHNSIAHCPGAMWRFLAFNLDCRCCYIQDTDCAFNWKRAERYLQVIEEHPGAAMVRSLQCSSAQGEMALILGGDTLVRPSRVDFDAARMLLGYITLNILHEDRINTFVHEPTRGRDDAAVEPLSKRLKREHIGPLPRERVPNKCHPDYGFDEQWLKEFAYYHLSDGRMITLLMNRDRPEDVIQQLDLAYQRAHGNVLIPP